MEKVRNFNAIPLVIREKSVNFVVSNYKTPHNVQS